MIEKVRYSDDELEESERSSMESWFWHDVTTIR